MRDRARLAGNISRPGVVLPDFATCHTPLFVFSPADGQAEAGKILVRINHTVLRGVTNNIRAAGYVERHNLRHDRYVLLSGEIE